MLKQVLLIILTCIFFEVGAQDINKFSLSGINESIAFPFTRNAPIHPGAEIGYVLKEKDKSRLIRSHSVYVGWYYHTKVQNAFYLRAETAWLFKVRQIATLDLFTGLGYMHTLYPGDIYELNSSGDFEEINQIGKPRALGTIGFGFTLKNNYLLEPFIRQEIGLETPFANGLPVMIHSFLKVGTYIKISKS